MLSDMVDSVDPGGVGEDARGGIIDQRVVFPTVPQPRDDIEIFARPLIAFVMRRMLGWPKMQLIDAYHSDEVQTFLDMRFKGTYIATW